MPKQVLIYTAAEVAAALSKAGFIIGEVSEIDDFDNVDGEVDLPVRKAHVQVGEGYLIYTVENDDETFTCSAPMQTVEQLIDYINNQ